MIRFPILSTILVIIPLAALAWPLARVINYSPPASPSPPQSLAQQNLTNLQTVITVASTHPFEAINITQGIVTTTITAGVDEIERPLEISKETGSATLLIEVKWSKESPESAVRLEVSPDHLETKTHTIWGQETVTEEVTFTWKLD